MPSNPRHKRRCVQARATLISFLFVSFLHMLQERENRERPANPMQKMKILKALDKFSADNMATTNMWISDVTPPTGQASRTFDLKTKDLRLPSANCE